MLHNIYKEEPWESDFERQLVCSKEFPDKHCDGIHDPYWRANVHIPEVKAFMLAKRKSLALAMIDEMIQKMKGKILKIDTDFWMRQQNREGMTKQEGFNRALEELIYHLKSEREKIEHE